MAINFAGPDTRGVAPIDLGAGEWMVYFNRHGAGTLPWCVAPASGVWEIAVAEISIHGPAQTKYVRKAAPDDEDGRPSAWITCSGRLTVNAAGEATIAADGG